MIPDIHQLNEEQYKRWRNRRAKMAHRNQNRSRDFQGWHLQMLRNQNIRNKGRRML